MNGKDVLGSNAEAGPHFLPLPFLQNWSWWMNLTTPEVSLAVFGVIKSSRKPH